MGKEAFSMGFINKFILWPQCHSQVILNEFVKILLSKKVIILQNMEDALMHLTHYMTYFEKKSF